MISQRKKNLRRSLLKKRQTATQSLQKQISLTQHIHQWLHLYQPKSIGFYWPIQEEFNMLPIVKKWLQAHPQHIATLPIIIQSLKTLEFHQWTPNMPMSIGAFNIPVPTQSTTYLPEALFIPCIGFNQDGFRLGYGGGFYDRTLASWPHHSLPITVGIAFEDCFVDDLFQEKHDIALDYIITDLKCHAFL